MAWIQLASLSNADFVDFDVIDQIINNLYFLRAAIPEVYSRRPDNSVLYSDGTTDTRLRIQSGVSTMPAFKGSYVLRVRLIKPHTGAADYPIQVTLQSNADIRVTISSQNNKEFYIRLFPTSRAAMRGVRVHWLAITKE